MMQGFLLSVTNIEFMGEVVSTLLQTLASMLQMV
jgi:hypothetical protein